MSEIQSTVLLSHIEEWMLELERVVRAFEDAVEEVGDVIDELEQLDQYGNTDTEGQIPLDQTLQRLEDALETAERVEGLVHVADTTLNEAIAGAQQVVEDHFGLDDESSEKDSTQAELAENKHSLPETFRGKPRWWRIHLVSSGKSGREDNDCGPLPEGTIILDGRYRLLQLLHRRTRLNLYLAQRLPLQSSCASTNGEQESLVAIRELVLTGLPLELHSQIEQAAFEEFVAPGVLGSVHLPGAGDRPRVESERHYLVMQLRRTRGEQRAVAVTLSQLVLGKRQWPLWLDTERALEWAVQLTRLVARLHRKGIVPGVMDPSTILVDREGAAEWSPVLLISWPPAPRFWPISSTPFSAKEFSVRLFPIVQDTPYSAFVAPEIIEGIWDELSDVYSLGALLYLLLTRYAPVAAARRETTASAQTALEGQSGVLPDEAEAIELIPPHLFNSSIPPVLEQIVLRALSLDVKLRYPSAVTLLEALEGVELR